MPISLSALPIMAQPIFQGNHPSTVQRATR